MNPDIEVVFPDSLQDVLQDRFEMPIYFILGGADDNYLSSLVGEDIEKLVAGKTVDSIPEKPYGVYASRSLLLSEGYARIFPLSMFYEQTWPILLDIEDKSERSKSEKVPTQVEMVWIIRALRRMGEENMAEALRARLLKSIYPKKLSREKIPQDLTVNTLSEVYLQLSDEQKDYSLVIIINDLPIQLDKTLGDALADISLTRCTDATLRAIRTSLDLISME